MITQIKKTTTNEHLQLGLKFQNFKCYFSTSDTKYSLDNNLKINQNNHSDKLYITQLTYRLKFNQYINMTYSNKQKNTSLSFKDDAGDDFININS